MTGRKVFFGKRAFFVGLLLIVFGVWINGVFIFDFGRVNALAVAVPIIGIALWIIGLINRIKGRTYSTDQ